MKNLKRVQHHTKIVATLGPASANIDMLEQMITVGLDVVRFNFSHGDRDFHLNNAKLVREASKRAGREVAIIADLQGPKIRVGKIKNGKISLKVGDKLVFDADLLDDGDENAVGLDYRDLPNDVRKGDILLLDDGLLTVEVIEVIDSKIITKVQNDADLKSNKGINKQGGGLSAAAITEKDINDIKTAIELGCDYVAVSFVKTASDMEFVRELVAKSTPCNQPKAGLIAKIERAEAVSNLDAILQVSDGVMVARGDLAVEIGNAAVPAVQKKIIARARKIKCFTITATQMMESMISNPVPTRAEVSDVANAVLDGTDAVMLSAETAIGKYPFETIKQIATVCAAAEQAQGSSVYLNEEILHTQKIDHAIAASAIFSAQQTRAKAIITLTESGTTAFQISRFNSNLPIFAFTKYPKIQRKMAIYRGVRPILWDISKDQNVAIAEAEEQLIARNVMQSGDIYVITTGQFMGKTGSTNTLQIRRAE